MGFLVSLPGDEGDVAWGNEITTDDDGRVHIEYQYRFSMQDISVGIEVSQNMLERVSVQRYHLVENDGEKSIIILGAFQLEFLHLSGLVCRSRQFLCIAYEL
jgi:hypothetical protein